MTAAPFSGQTALVTGASKGIGAATAEALARAGAHVVLTGRDTKALEQVEERIFEAGGSATIAPIDLTESDGIARLATAVTQRWQKLDILVINAAVLPQLSSVTDIEARAFNQALTTNVLATQALLASFDGLLRKSADPRVIGLTSGVAQRPRAYWGAYAASKAAFEVLLDCYAQETRNVSKPRSSAFGSCGGKPVFMVDLAVGKLGCHQTAARGAGNGATRAICRWFVAKR